MIKRNKKETTVNVYPEKDIEVIVMHLINIKKNQDCFFIEEEFVMKF